MSARRRLHSPARQKGFALIEVLVSLSLFAFVGVSLYKAFAGMIDLLTASRAQITATELLREQVEIVRNLPFASVGEVAGIPSGVLTPTKTVTRGNMTFRVDTTVQNVDDPFDGTIGGSPNDTASADYRRVEVTLTCISVGCVHMRPFTFTTTQAPKSLEATGSNGALFIRVLDASGMAVPGALIRVVNQATNPDTVIDDTTDNDGWLKIVGAPPGTNAYEITATKSGWSTDRTYVPNGSGLSNPSKPHSTVSNQQVTQASFAIDELGSVSVRTITDACAPVANVPITLRGAKTLGTNSGSTVYKYNQSLTTNASGLLSLPSMEWDTYQATIGGSTYHLSGSVPINPLSLDPGQVASFNLVVESAVPRALAVLVKDQSTGLPVTDAQVTISRSGFTAQTLYTGRGYLGQTSWIDGPGQATYSDATRYFDSDGNVSISSGASYGYGAAGELRLRRLSSNGNYVTSGQLTSSTFDTGSASNFHQILWAPTNQPSQAGSNSVRMQIATNPTNTGSETWTYRGPDGTSATYYTTTSNVISAAHDGDRYLRYRVFLSSNNASYTPNVADVNFTFTSDCVPLGHVMFTGLPSSSSSYTVTVTKSGYVTSVTSKAATSNWQEHTVTIHQ